MDRSLLSVEDLHLSLNRSKNSPKILHGISFEIHSGEVVALVGESGCGKSMTASAVLGLIPPSCQLTGQVIFENQDLATLSQSKLSFLRGTRLSLILQDPSLALNPVVSIGRQLIEGLLIHKKMDWKQAHRQGIEWLQRVGISNPALRMSQYPHEISGGMKQRVLIAMALICNPSLVIADEPTTALDVTVQKEILDLLQQLQREEKMSLFLITHDLKIVAHYCQRVFVMYAGQIVESGLVAEVFSRPQHPYTQALLRATIKSNQQREEPLYSLKGMPPRPERVWTHCSFVSRCPYAMEICQQQPPPNISKGSGTALCWLPKRHS